MKVLISGPGIPKPKKQKKVVAFVGQLKHMKMTIDAAGDKGGEISIIYRDEKDYWGKLNEVMKTNDEIYVVIQTMH
jgi:hypothetical protein